MAVDAGHDVIERRQQLVVEVEPAVGQNVALRPLEDPEPFEPLVQRVDLGQLAAHAVGAEAVGHGQRLRMVGDPQIFQTQHLGRLGHVFQRVVAVALGRVVMKDSNDVFNLNKVGQVALLRRFDLAGAFAEFRRHIFQSERPEQVRLVADARRAMRPGQLVLVEFEAARLRPPAHLDVMLLAPGEIMQRERELGVIHHAQVGLDDEAMAVLPGGDGDARLGIAAAEDLGDARQPDETVHDRPGVVGADEEVDVLDGFLAPPQAAARLDATDAGRVAQSVEQAEGDGLGLVDAHAVGRLLEEGDAFEDLLLRLFAETFQPGDAAGLAGGLELVEVVHSQLVVQRLDLLRPQAADAQHLEQAGRRFGAELVVEWQRAGGDERGDLFPEGVADAADAGQPSGGHRLAEVAFELFYGAGAVAVGVTTKGVFALEFEQDGDLVEDGGDFFFVHGGRTPRSQALPGNALPGGLLPAGRTRGRASQAVCSQAEPGSERNLGGA